MASASMLIISSVFVIWSRRLFFQAFEIFIFLCGFPAEAWVMMFVKTARCTPSFTPRCHHSLMSFLHTSIFFSLCFSLFQYFRPSMLPVRIETTSSNGDLPFFCFCTPDRANPLVLKIQIVFSLVWLKDARSNSAI